MNGVQRLECNLVTLVAFFGRPWSGPEPVLHVYFGQAEGLLDPGVSVLHQGGRGLLRGGRQRLGTGMRFGLERRLGL